MKDVKTKKLILLPLAALALAQPASAVVTLFDENFTGAEVDVGGRLDTSGGGEWGVTVWGTTVGATGTLSAPASNDYAVFTSTYLASGSGGGGTQFRPNNDGARFSGVQAYNNNLADVVVSFRYAMTQTQNNPNTRFDFQVRQLGRAGTGPGLWSNGTTNAINFAPIFSADDNNLIWQEFSINLSQSQTADFINIGGGQFNGNNIELFFNLTQAARSTNGDNIVRMYIDDIKVTAIPEPSAALLSLLALPVLARRRRA